MDPSERSVTPPERVSDDGTRALDRVFGHLLLVVLCEVVFVLLVLRGSGTWFDDRWGALTAFALGGLGLPWTLPVPYLVTEGGGAAPVAVLLVAPVVNLFLRAVGYWLRADGADVPVDQP